MKKRMTGIDEFEAILKDLKLSDHLKQIEEGFYSF